MKTTSGDTVSRWEPLAQTDQSKAHDHRAAPVVIHSLRLFTATSGQYPNEAKNSAKLIVISSTEGLT